MSYKPEQTSGFSYAMALALLLHGFIILGITFNAAQNKSPAKQMEVTLSRSSSENRPDEADFLAQSNQQGSGSEDEKYILQNTRDPLFDDTEVKTVDPFVIPEEQQQEQDTQPRVITTIGESQLSYRSEERADSADPNAQQGSDKKKNLAELSREIASLEARLAERQQAYTRKPRVKVFTSASTMAAANASYIHAWRDRIETVGNLHYPQEARQQQLYGDVRLLVGINANGTVEEIRILEKSGHEMLDRAAMESIRLASPFEPFDAALSADYDRIEIIRTWQFRKNRLQSER